jgi:DNA (cytosine-5)-methyltransferase 1
VRSLKERYGSSGTDLDDAEAGHLVVNTRQDPIVSSVAQPLDTGSRFGQAVLEERPYVGTVRRLTPLECQRLMGFPDDFYEGIEISDKQRYRQQGNAVAVPVARWTLDRIQRSHDGRLT